MDSEIHNTTKGVFLDPLFLLFTYMILLKLNGCKTPITCTKYVEIVKILHSWYLRNMIANTIFKPSWCTSLSRNHRIRNLADPVELHAPATASRPDQHGTRPPPSGSCEVPTCPRTPGPNPPSPYRQSSLTPFVALLSSGNENSRGHRH